MIIPITCINFLNFQIASDVLKPFFRALEKKVNILKNEGYDNFKRQHTKYIVCSHIQQLLMYRGFLGSRSHTGLHREFFTEGLRLLLSCKLKAPAVTCNLCSKTVQGRANIIPASNNYYLLN